MIRIFIYIYIYIYIYVCFYFFFFYIVLCEIMFKYISLAMEKDNNLEAFSLGCFRFKSLKDILVRADISPRSAYNGQC